VGDHDPDKHLKNKVVEEPRETKSARPERSHTVAVTKSDRRTALVLFGIILIIVSTVFAFVSLQEPDQKTIEDTVEYNMFQDALASKELNCYNGPGSRCFSAGSVMSVGGDELMEDISTADEQYRDYEFYLEIIDVSDYPVKYTRSGSEGNAIATAEPNDAGGVDGIRTLETAVNIFIDDDEVHTARFVMQIWKA